MEILQCLSLLLLVIVTEIASTMLVYKKKELFLRSLTLHMKKEMEVSEAAYGLNVSDTQMWDEIQLEVSFLIVTYHNVFLVSINLSVYLCVHLSM